MIDVSQVILIAVAALYPLTYALRMLGVVPRWAPRSRTAIATATLDAVLVLVLAHALIAWWAIPTPLWVVPVGLSAAGVVGAIIRWPDVSWMKPGRGARVGAILAVLHLAVVTALIVVILA